jgi:hypothetical protein
MRSEPPHFEVYCRSCDVTFPVGTRHCIHCGGATTQGGSRGGSLPDGLSGFGPVGSKDFDPEWGNATPFPALTEEQAEAEAESIFAMDGQLAPFDPVEQASEQPASGRRFLRSLGSLVWIALLIAFSLYRGTCGD